MRSTFGAPAGALVRWIVPGLESSYVRTIFASVKSCSGLGSAFGLPFEDICGDCRTQAAPATIETSRSEATARFMAAFLSCVYSRVESVRATSNEHAWARGADRIVNREQRSNLLPWRMDRRE